MNNALSSPNDGWQLLGYKRPEHGYSFSQVLFRAIGLPESISDGASNITMHQLLRLLYVDQLTPVPRIFRVENFDTWQTRSEEHTSELQSLMRISYAVFCLKK